MTPFEEATGCQVNVKTAPTSDDMVNLMKTGQYDVVSASGDASLRLIASGDVEPVNTDLVPNYVDVFDALKMKAWNSVDGVAYGVPHGRGANLLMYNTDEVSPAPTSWGAVFDDASAYKGKVTAYDSPIYIADAALYLMKTKPDLGIKNPYALDDKQFTAAVDLLKAQNAHIGEYWSDYTKEIQAFKNGDSVIGTTWQIIVNLAQADKAKVEAVLPSEGATGWSDTWMVATKSKHKTCAYKWLDHIISPRRTPQVAEWFGEAPSNAKSCDLDRGQVALRHVPRRGRGLLRPGLVLEHADRPVPRRAHRRRLQGLRRVDGGLAGDQGLTCREREGGTVLRGFSSSLHRHPRLRLVLLLALPMLVLVVVYLGALAVLLLSAFWSTDVFTGDVVRSFTTDNFREVVTNDTYRTVILRTVRGGRGGHRHLRGARVPDGVLHGQGGVAAGPAAARRRGAHPAVGELPGQGVRLAGDAGRRRRRQLGAGAVRAAAVRASG